MLLLLPILLQVQVVSDKRPTSMRVDSTEFPVWVDFTRCLTDGMQSTPEAIEERSPEYDTISEKCRKTVEGNILASRYKGISSKPEHRSYKKALAIIDGTDRHMKTVYSRMPDVKKINARIEKMGLGVTVYDPIAHLFEEYSGCVSDKYNEAPFRHHPSERVAGWRAAIKSCEALKASLKLDAELIMAKLPDFQDYAKRKSAIDSTFDGHDEVVVKATSVDWAEPE
jgi:hypothetical protein